MLINTLLISAPPRITAQQARGEVQGGEFGEGALPQHGLIVQGGPSMEQHLVLGGDPRKLGHPLLGEGANRGGQHPKIWGGWRRGTPQIWGLTLIWARVSEPETSRVRRVWPRMKSCMVGAAGGRFGEG